MFESFFDMENVPARLAKRGDFLAKLDYVVDREDFCPILSRICEADRKGNAGRKSYDEVMVFKILVIQSLYNLSDEKTEVMRTSRKRVSLQMAAALPCFVIEPLLLLGIARAIIA